MDTTTNNTHSLAYWLKTTDRLFATQIFDAFDKEGRAGHERRHEIIDSVSDQLTADIPAEDLATTQATLEKIARSLGWDEEFSHRHRPGFGPEAGHHRGRFGGPGHGGHGRMRFARMAQESYERGFDAGFTRGRDAQ